MANNALIFDGALSGAVGGLSTRWITEPNTLNYDTVQNIALAFAVAVDGLIPVNASLDTSAAFLIQGISQGLMESRFPRDTNGINAAAQAAVGMYNALNAQSLSMASQIANTLRGTNMTVLNGLLSPFPRPRRFFDWDYFWTGGVTSGTIGRMGWNLLGTGTPAYTRVTASFSNAAKALLSTSAATNNRSVLCFGETEARACANPRDFVECQVVWNMSTALTDKRVFFGWSSNLATDPLAVSTAFGLLYDSTIGPNYQLISRSGGVGNPIDTGRPAATAAGELVTFMQGSSVPTDYSVFLGVSGSTTINLGTISAPNAVLNHGFRVETLANAIAGVNVGYWGMQSTIFTGIYASDTALFGS